MEQTAVRNGYQAPALHNSDTSPAAEQESVLVLDNKLRSFARAGIEQPKNRLAWPPQRTRAASSRAALGTYALMKNGRHTAMFAFQREKKKVTVTNSHGVLDGREASRFSHQIFSRFESVNKVCFRSRQTVIRRAAFGGKPNARSNDAVIVLPAVMPDYLENATRFTRHNIKYFLNRVKRDYPSFRYQKYENSEISRQLCYDIIHLNRIRMVEKDRSSPILDEETERLVTLVQSNGLIGVLTIKDKLCAGVIFYRAGNRYHLRMLSHDPQHNAYGLGMLCCYLTICECLDQASGVQHAAGKQERYRYRLVRQQHDYDSLVIHRPRASLLVRLDCMLYFAFIDCSRQLRLLLFACMRVGVLLLRLPLLGKNLLQMARKWRTGVAW